MKLEKILKKYENYIKKYKTKEMTVDELASTKKIEKIIDEKRKRGIFITAEETAKLYNKAAKNYIFVRVNIPEYLTFFKSLIEQVRFTAKDKILSIGSGCGILETFLAKEFKCEIIGIDIAKKLVEVAKNLAKKEGVKNIKFICGDARKLKFKDDSFDKVISHATLHWTETSLFTILEEAKRVLKKGGSFSFAYNPEFSKLVPKEKEVLSFLKRQDFSVKLTHMSFHHPIFKKKVTWPFIVARI